MSTALLSELSEHIDNALEATEAYRAITDRWPQINSGTILFGSYSKGGAAFYEATTRLKFDFHLGPFGHRSRMYRLDLAYRPENDVLHFRWHMIEESVPPPPDPPADGPSRFSQTFTPGG